VKPILHFLAGFAIGAIIALAVVVWWSLKDHEKDEVSS
jgi:hypothetical protein